MRKEVLKFFLLFFSFIFIGCVTSKKSSVQRRQKISLVLQSELPDIAHRNILEFWDQCGFDDIKILIHFLAQCAHESGKFLYKRELLNFALDKDRLYRLFPNRLSGREVQVDLCFDKFFQDELHEDEMKLIVAELVYGQREDLGNLNDGDGRLYIGRGYIQLTGRSNYAAFTDYLKKNLVEKSFEEIDCISSPHLVEIHYPMLSAIWYFHSKNLFAVCSKGLDDDTIIEVTIIVNGKTNGLKDRIKWTRYYENLLREYL